VLFYGQIRTLDIEFPDLVDIRKFALKSSTSRLKSKSGDIKNSMRSSSLKQRTRRRWKKKARRENNSNIRSDLINL